MVAGVPEHGHCEICSRIVVIDERFCDRKECLAAHEKNIAEKKRQVWMMIGLIAAALILSKIL